MNGEFLPVTDRTMSFRLTARTIRRRGGISSDDTVLTVSAIPSSHEPEWRGSSSGMPIYDDGWGGSVANLVSPASPTTAAITDPPA